MPTGDWSFADFEEGKVIRISRRVQYLVVVHSKVCAEMHPVDLSVDDLLIDCDVQTTRRSGPGGQHRNKVESAIVITHRPSSVVGQASERRSQHENRRIAITRLRINLALSVRTQRGDSGDYQPTEIWKSHVNSMRIVVSGKHQDFPPMLAEAMDVISSVQFDVPTAAQRLQCTTSQLIKFLKIEPHAFSWLNSARKTAGLKSYS